MEGGCAVERRDKRGCLVGGERGVLEEREQRVSVRYWEEEQEEEED